MDKQDRPEPQRSEFVRWARNGVALGMAVIIAVPMLTAAWKRHHPPAAQAPSATRQMGAAPQQSPLQLADFRGEEASPQARLMANWIVGTRNNHKRAFILVDKKDARVYVFTPAGQLADSSPVLLGEAHGDDVLPGVGDKPLAAIRPEEKTTPAGRFVAEPGTNADNEDVIWVDYKDAISMHRVRPWVAAERRLERLASLTTDDNRISFGCINLPVSFYEDVARPAVTKYGAIIYVLPEVRTVQQVFGAYDVTDPAQVAAARPPAAAKPAAQG
ncbi:hypothetical protein [Ramlibacter sp. AN1133]|uniref:hypothetical protein n=1 Tax=Ramlibacter sp. AN1133 TaxID=3133429 RepID=UPI0030BAAEA9